MRRLVVVGSVSAALVMNALPSIAQYPPTPGADCAATAISTFSPWTVGTKNGVLVRVENHGSEFAKCVATLQVESPGKRAKVSPHKQKVKLPPGRAAGAAFKVKPRVAGTYTLTACATSKNPDEAHPADDCTSASVTASA
jgi:hypothetical protein